MVKSLAKSNLFGILPPEFLTLMANKTVVTEWSKLAVNLFNTFYVPKLHGF